MGKLKTVDHWKCDACEKTWETVRTETWNGQPTVVKLYLKHYSYHPEFRVCRECEQSYPRLFQRLWKKVCG